MNIVDYVKMIVVKIDDFVSEVIDESNFGVNDEYAMAKFASEYSGIDGYVILKMIVEC